MKPEAGPPFGPPLIVVVAGALLSLLAWQSFRTSLPPGVLVLGFLLTLLLGIVIYFYGEARRREAILDGTNRALVEQIKQRTLAEEQLKQLANELEERVQRRTQEVLESHLFLDSIIENLPSMIFVKEAENLSFVRINRVAEELMGFPREQMLGRTDFDFFPEEQASFFTNTDRKVLEGREAVDVESEPIDTHDRGLRILHTRKIPLFFGDGEDEAAFLLGISEDITERLEAERQLRRQNEALERSNKELDDFAYIASHDLREPLRGIHNYAGFLLEDYQHELDEEGVMRLETIMRLTQRMGSLIDSLLDYSRVGRVDLAIEYTDLNVVLEEVLDSLHISLQEKQVEIRIPKPLPTVICDRVRIAEVFRNLISNAAKYNDKEHKWIEIDWRFFEPSKAPSSVRPKAAQGPLPHSRQFLHLFSVRDNGIGIAPKHQDSIFRIFRRLHGRDRYGGGIGAGLTIVKKIIERHQGAIWLESTPKEGTTFFFTLHEGDDSEA